MVMPRAFGLVEVKEGVSVIHATLGAQGAGFVQQRLGQRGFARVHVGKNANNRVFHAASSKVTEWLVSSKCFVTIV